MLDRHQISCGRNMLLGKFKVLDLTEIWSKMEFSCLALYPAIGDESCTVTNTTSRNSYQEANAMVLDG